MFALSVATRSMGVFNHTRADMFTPQPSPPSSPMMSYEVPVLSRSPSPDVQTVFPFAHLQPVPVPEIHENPASVYVHYKMPGYESAKVTCDLLEDLDSDGDPQYQLDAAALKTITSLVPVPKPMRPLILKNFSSLFKLEEIQAQHVTIGCYRFGSDGLTSCAQRFDGTNWVDTDLPPPQAVTLPMKYYILWLK